jgi:hypothetical protein
VAVAVVQVCLQSVQVVHLLVLQVQMLEHKTVTLQQQTQVQVVVEITTTQPHPVVVQVVQELFTSGGGSSYGTLCKN